ncbi:MAG: hypothetical protein J6Y77_02140 [Paludibacteraceae bacterium]|nr:hypothetical protein [Paludibacteraceae bacterium]
MKTNLLVRTAWAVLVCVLLGACSHNPQKDENPDFNPFVEAFTSGTVSKTSDICVVLSNPVEDEWVQDGKWEKAVKIKPKTEAAYTLSEDRTTLLISPKQNLKRGQTYTVELQLDKLVKAEKPHDLFRFSFDVLDWNAHAYFCEPQIDEEDDTRYHLTLSLKTADQENDEEVEKCGKFSEELQYHWEHLSQSNLHEARINGIQASAEARELRFTYKADGKGEEKSAVVTIPSVSEFVVWDVKFVETPVPCVEITFNKNLNPTQDLKGLAFLEGQNTTKYEIEKNRIRLFPETGRKGEAAVVVNQGILSKSGLRLGEDQRFTVDLGNDEPMLRFLSSATIVPATDQITLPFQCRHLCGVIVRVYKIPERNALQFFQENELGSCNGLRRVGRLIAHETVFFDETEKNLANTKTFALNLSKLVNLEPGAFYHVTISSNFDFSVYPGAHETPVSRKEIEAREEMKAKQEFASCDYQGNGYYINDQVGEWKWSEQDDPTKPAFYSWRRMQHEVNLLATNLGLMAESGADNREVQVWVHHLIDASPLRDVTVNAYNYQGDLLATAKTDGDGRCTFSKLKNAPFLLSASKGDERNYLRIDNGSSLSTSSFAVDGEQLKQGTRGFIYGERGVWRPGDTLHLGFILNDRAGNIPEKHPVTLKLYTPLGQLHSSRVQTGTAHGLYCFAVPLEEDAPTGAWEAKISFGGAEYTKTVRVETIKPNRLKIEFKVENDRLQQGSTPATLHSEWLTGGKVHGLKYDLQAEFYKASSSFNGYEKFTFDDLSREFSPEESRLQTGKLDQDGNAKFNIDLHPSTAAPGRLWAQLTTKVYEESGDFSIHSQRVPYSPYSRYIGLKSPQTGSKPLDTEKAHTFQLVCLDEDGKPVANANCKVQVFRLDWYWWWESNNSSLAHYVNQSYNQPVYNTKLSTDASGKASFQLNFGHDDWGTYYIRAYDPVSGHSCGLSAYFDWPYMTNRNLSASDKATKLPLASDKQSYQVGDVAHITFNGTTGARAIVNIENGARILSSTCEFITDKNASVDIPITADMQPNAYVHISLIQPYKQSQNDCPIRLYGYLPLTVDDPASHLSPVIAMPDELRPSNDYNITVSEKSGRPMSYSLAVVDEGLLSLTNFKTPDPWKAFNSREALGVRTWDIYNSVVGAYGGRIEQLFSIGGDEFLNNQNKAVTNRFAPVVVFQGPFTLEKGKTTTHRLTMPNYNGEVRVMVVATDGKAFGHADKQVPVRQSLMVLGTLPRTVGLDEEITVPATAMTTNRAIDAKLTITASGGLSIDGNNSQSVSIPASGDKTVAFHIKTGNQEGTGRVRIEAKGGGESAVYETELSIVNRYTPVSEYGSYTIAAGQSQKISPKAFGLPGSNSLEIEVSGIQPINLNQRLDDLIGYPHGCIEQTTSKIFAQLLLPDLCELSPTQKSKVENNIKHGLDRLRMFKTSQGGMSYWPGSPYPNDWGSAYALHCMHKAERSGYSLPAGLKASVTNYVKNVASTWKPGNSRYGACDETEQAYRLYVLAICGKADIGAMNRLRTQENLSSQARWLLAGSYAAAGRKDVAENLTKAPDGEYDYRLDYSFGSPIRDRAVKVLVLTGLGQYEESAKHLKEITKELESGHWMSTQSTLFALYAVSYFYNITGHDKELHFTGSYSDEKWNVDQKELIWYQTLEEGVDKFGDIQLTNKGKSIIYVKVKRTGTPARTQVSAYQNHLALNIFYTDMSGLVIDPADLEQGTNFYANVTVKNPNDYQLHNLAVTQQIPSGWEILNTRFNSENGQKADGLSYQDIRDDRVYSYIDNLSGKASVSFKIKLCATYKGRYYLPACKACCMYDESTSANTEDRMVSIK